MSDRLTRTPRWRSVVTAAAVAVLGLTTLSAAPAVAEPIAPAPASAPGVNLLENPGFGDVDMDMWTITVVDGQPASTGGGYIQRNLGSWHLDSPNLTHSLRWWLPQTVEFHVDQTVSITTDGIYNFRFFAQGGDAGADWAVEAVVLVDGVEVGRNASTGGFTGFGNWQEAALSGVALEAGDQVTVRARVRGAGGNFWGSIDNFQLYRVEAPTLVLGPELLLNPGFELYEMDMWDLIYDVPPSAGAYFGGQRQEDAGEARTGVAALNWYGPNALLSMDVEQTITVANAGPLDFSAWFRGGDANVTAHVLVNDVIVESTLATSTAAWNVWVPLTLTDIDVPAGAEVTVRISVIATANGSWGYIDDVSLRQWVDPSTLDPDPAVPSTIFVERVENLRPDWISGVDIGSVLSQEESGVTWYNWEDEIDDLFEIFADNGVNLVRIRIWNDPWNRNFDPPRGFGGGNTDAERAIEIGRRATEAGMGVAFNFHYSDFWADPAKQMVPRAWAGTTLTQRAQLVYQFTYDTVRAALEADVDIWHVQIGNENQGGSMAGLSGWDNFALLFNEGARAVRELEDYFNHPMQTLAHFTNPQSGFVGNVNQLISRNVDFDMIGASYYPFWHGSLSNLTSVLTTVRGLRPSRPIEVMVVETAYAWTAEDGDGHPNTVDATTPVLPYPLSVQGQANAIRNVAQATADADGLGIILWEPAWTPVGPPSDVVNNRLLWEAHGSGWATSYAAIFDPGDAGQWFGGTSWDNQSLFDFNGRPLASLRIFEYIWTGANPVGGIVADTVIPAEGEVIYFTGIDSTYVLANVPDEVIAVYMDNSRTTVPVVWDAAAIDAAIAITSGVDTFEIPGVADTSAGPMNVVLFLTILPINLLQNPGFETGSPGANGARIPLHWQFDGCPSLTTGNFLRRNYSNRSGNFSFSFNGATNCRIFQDVVVGDDGIFTFQGFTQGNHQSNTRFTAYAIIDGVEYRGEAIPLGGWLTWTRPFVTFEAEAGTTVRVGVHLQSGSGTWGTMDDFHLFLGGELPNPPVVTIEGVAEVGGTLTTLVTGNTGAFLQRQVQWIADGVAYGYPVSLSALHLTAPLTLTAAHEGVCFTADVSLTRPGSGIFEPPLARPTEVCVPVTPTVTVTLDDDRVVVAIYPGVDDYDLDVDGNLIITVVDHDGDVDVTVPTGWGHTTAVVGDDTIITVTPPTGHEFVRDGTDIIFREIPTAHAVTVNPVAGGSGSADPASAVAG
ncbi:MAG: glycosyl hydrolase 53 family protein, partial [Promicromonosporaceae bacterium]|nr:glycosyl hydrolase 53 family protein [Promicromonosporaceae bacterium]